MKKVYIAGKLNAGAVDYIKNIHNMIVMAEIVRNKGYSVFVPCLDCLAGLVIGNYGYDDYFNNNLPWLEAADYVYVCPNSEDSKGVKAEILHAKKHNIPVIYKMEEFLNGI
jgi:hypothetical protein